MRFDVISHHQLQDAAETPEMGVSIVSDGMGKPFSVHPAVDDDLLGYIVLNLSFFFPISFLFSIIQ